MNEKKVDFLVYSHKLDTRYGINKIVTHDKEEVNCCQIENLNEIYNHPNYKDCKLIFIDELQFFKNSFEIIKHMVEKDRKFIIASGLDTDYKREPFGDVIKCITIANDVEKFSGKCSYCDNDSLFSKRIWGGTSTIGVGSDSYAPVCRDCYISES